MSGNKKINKLSSYSLYSLLYLVTALFTFGWFAVFQKSMIWNVDGFMQHYPLLVKLHRMISDVLHGNGISLWAEDIGLGNDLLGNMSIIVCDPFNYIAAAFPIQYIDIGYSIAVILRLYTAGWAMLMLLRFRKCTKLQCVIGALAYSYCSWGIGCIRHAFFLNPLILFPLVILGVEKVFHKKSPAILIVSVFLSLISYVYFAYMTAIFVFIYICVRYWFGESERQWKDFGGLIAKFVGYVLVATLMGMPVILAVFYSLMSADKSAGVDAQFLLSVRDAFRLVPSLIDNGQVNGNYSYIGANALSLLAIPAMFFSRKDKVKRVPIIMFVFSFLMAGFPFWGRIMNGMSYSVGRWCYVLACFLVWSTTEMLDENIIHDARVKKAQKYWCYFLMIALIFGKFLMNSLTVFELITGFMNIGFCFLFASLLSSGEKEKSQKFILPCMVVNIVCIYAVVFSPNCMDGTNAYMNIGKSYDSYYGSVEKYADKINDDDFYRVEHSQRISSDVGYSNATHTPANESLFWGTRTIFGYLSTLDSNYLEFNKIICNNSGSFRRMCVYSNDNRSRLDFLEGVKYFVSTNRKSQKMAPYGMESYKKRKKYRISKSQYDVGLGYVYSEAISKEDLLQLSYLEREQAMMQAVVLENDQESLIAKAQDLSYEMKEIPYEFGSSSTLAVKDNAFEVTGANQDIILNFEDCSDVELFVQFEGLHKEAYSKEDLFQRAYANPTVYDKYKFTMNNLGYEEYGNFTYIVYSDFSHKRVVNALGEAQGISDVEDYLTNVGYCKNGTNTLRLRFSSPGRYSFRSLKVYAVPHTQFEQQAKELTSQRFTMTKKYGDSIEGKVEAKQDGVLFLNVLYHPGWKVYVDGNKVDTMKANICFLGVPVEAGNHTVVLKYEPFGFRFGVLCSVAGIVVFVVLMILYSKKREKDNE